MRVIENACVYPGSIDPNKDPCANSPQGQPVFRPAWTPLRRYFIFANAQLGPTLAPALKLSLKYFRAPLRRALVPVTRTHQKCFQDNIHVRRWALRSFRTMPGEQSWWRGVEGAEPLQDGPSAASDPRPLNFPQEEPTEQLLTRRIHIMGMGSIGTFIAHSLKCLPNPPPLSLTMHKPEMYKDFKHKRRVLRLINPKTHINDEQTEYDVDLAETDPDTGYTYWKHIPHSIAKGVNKPLHPPTEDEILPSGEVYMHAVIVTVKSKDTVAALRNVKHRLNAHSTICLIQNGMGQVDQLNREVFTDPATRPTYMLGIISHGVHLASNFVAIHAGFGTVALGVVRDLDKFPLPTSTTPNPSSLSPEERSRLYPTDADLYSALSSRYLLRTLTRSPILACAAFPALDLLQLQLEKLAINAVLNPLTALLNLPNGRLLYNPPLAKTMRLLLAEISLVLRSLPEFEGVPNVRMRFSPQRLETLVMSVAAKTAENSSSMREDVRKGRATEVEYINGYVVKRGEEMGITCVLNYMVMQLVLGKTWAGRRAEGEALPLGVSRLEGKMQSGRVGKEGGVMLEDVGTIGKV
jgi:2-dehydropantoate 2-reductase